ncbi:MAG: ABC transporter permease [Nitrospinota bacterium]
MQRSLSLSKALPVPGILEGDRLRHLSGFALTGIVAIPILGPLVFLAWKGLGPGLGEFLVKMGELGLPWIVARVCLLAVITTGLALTWAVPLAWITARTDLPGREMIHWLAPLPLAIPPYVGALVYQILLAPAGFVNTLLAQMVGLPPSQVQVVNIYSLLGAAWVLSLFTFPYIYLLVRAALDRANPALEEVAQATGLSRWEVARHVILPLLRPALLAGGLMVFLYSWADFGVVSLLRVRTLTTVIYDFVQGTMGWTIPAGLSVVLVVLTVGLLLTQLRVLGRARYTQVAGRSRPPERVPLGRGARQLAYGFVAVVLGCSFFLPLLVLVLQASRIGGRELAALLGLEWQVVLNSLWMAALGATLALSLALAVGWFQERRRRGGGASMLFQVGYAIPGTVLGLGMVGFFHTTLPWVYASPLVVALGYVVLYTTPAFQAVKAALEQLSLSLEEAARGLGRGPLRTFWEVTLPLIRPGLMGGWVLVFILSMRELAATLIVRPAGFDTLPVRIWIYTMDIGPDPRAAALALTLVGIVAIPWLLLLIWRPKEIAWSS